ncbi:Meckel syndrome type 1 [Paramuricea clavata]|uniref:Meckel syndrome type 1 n=1 Tax=Paramuricea clavata TaxID=317549 RepID=A0A6S7FPK7_PARCT|nr:Meckel syndrome type 1 [Paramuricea clavata]
MAEDLENVNVGHYRSLDLPKNLALRVKLRKVTAASSIPVASASRLGSTAESLRNVEDLGQEAIEMARMGRSSHEATSGDQEEIIVKWQEKLFSQREEVFYSNRPNCYSVLQEQYHRDITNLRHKNGRRNHKIFTYVDNDDYANTEEVCKTMTTDPSEMPHYLTNNMVHVRRRNIDRRSARNRLGHHGPRTNIVTDDQRELAKQNSHVISTPFKIMYIMADLSLDDRVGTLDDEYILCSIKIDGTGQITIKPDLNSSKSPYRIQTSGDLKEVYEYTLEHASQEVTRDEKEQEIKSYDELYNRHAMYLASQVGSEFHPLPQAGVLNTSIFGEIVSAEDFEYDGLYVHFFMELPKYWSSQGSPHLSGVTHTCFVKATEKSNVAHFSFPFEFHISYQPPENDHEDFIRWPTLFLEVLSVDQWERFRTEGYGYITVPNKAGTHEITVNTWRPTGNGLVPKMRRFFIGGSPELEDVTYVKQPAGSEDHKVLSKFGFKTATSGSVRVKLNIVQQYQGFMESQKTKKKVRTMIHGVRGFGVMESLAQVLDAFQRARKRMQTARGTLPSVR